ncbi:coenzyme F420-0:L-glutamate ligase [Agrococcus jejuensis]|uniref:Coenzyme F420-0:L-glutamate ligase / coenzyme F420-1:gamma-L-glutamate ligase n=1 Tax=Agrococcus jejuensis TaxID=399736 RepID=A0A1G8B346_9MICO|nr:coenzyme F420-0:L-glutamate ligase [Agrococcus jejuensis]SDH27050.1 coenzyme F420-0:L-glutamate ligase / coenzyme F420-1:gamma-L-glutamate ligase [Agrococcus jejuensis]
MSRLEAWSVDGIGEIVAGDDLARIVGDAIAPHAPAEGDVVVVTSKIVSKAEGRMRHAADREQAITDETVRVVASRAHPGGVTRIVQDRNGFVMAAAGVDASNTPEGTILLLPVDPDASALALATALRDRFEVAIGVVVSDTFGRPWRAGQTDVAIGAAGIRVIEPLAGSVDTHGRPLVVSAAAVADEIASTAELVAGKTSGRPVTIVRGLGRHVLGLDEPGARALVRDADSDMFRLGSAEAHAEGFAEGYAAGLTAARVAAPTEHSSDTPSHAQEDPRPA